jgi:hypothetical protein
VLAFLALCVVLLVRPASGLLILWTIVIPLLPLAFVVAPGLWRNVCPMAATSQLPRVLGLSLARPMPRWLGQYGYVIGIMLFVGIVFAREPLFNSNGTALALLLASMLGAALVGGVALKGKAGWCNSICPLRPLQALYGQTPVVPVKNSHCKPCVGCTKNCPDLKPDTAHRDELRNRDRNRARYRAVFAGLLPGLILAFYTADHAATLTARAAHFGAFVLWSLGTFLIAEAALKIAIDKVALLYGAASLSLFYWFNVPVVVNGFGTLLAVSPPDAVTWIARENVVLLSIVFVVRTFAKDRATTAVAHGGTVTVGALAAANKGPAEATSDAYARVTHRPERRRTARRMRNVAVTLMPERRSVEVRPGALLLECAHELGLVLASTRNGESPGADPLFVVAGTENLSPPEDAERTTLERLGLDGRARLAGWARVQGDVVISLAAPLDEGLAAWPAESGRSTQRRVSAAARARSA